MHSKKFIPPKLPWVPPPAKTTSARRDLLLDGDLNFCHQDVNMHHSRYQQTSFRRDNELDDMVKSYADESNKWTETRSPKEQRAQSESRECSVGSKQCLVTSRRRREALEPTGGSALQLERLPLLVKEWVREINRSTNLIFASAREILKNENRCTCHGNRLEQQSTADWDTDPFDSIFAQTEVLQKGMDELLHRIAMVCAEYEQTIDNIDISNAKYRHEINQLKSEFNDLATQLETSKRSLVNQQEESLKFVTVQESLESMKKHLQLKLRQRESECSRLKVQVRDLQRNRAQELGKVEAEQISASQAYHHLRDQKTLIKEAARAQKRRAERAEAALSECQHIIYDLQRRLDQKEVSLGDSEQHSTHYKVDAKADSPTNSEDYYRLKQDNKMLRETTDRQEARFNSVMAEVEELRHKLAQAETYAAEHPQITDHPHTELHHHSSTQASGSIIKMATGDRINSPKIQAPMNASQDPKPNTTAARNNNSCSTDVPQLEPHPKETLEDVADNTELRRELALGRRQREELERRSAATISDLREQLAKAQTTNRSLEAFIGFLKRSYTSVFGDNDILPPNTCLLPVTTHTTNTIQ